LRVRRANISAGFLKKKAVPEAPTHSKALRGRAPPQAAGAGWLAAPAAGQGWALPAMQQHRFVPLPAQHAFQQRFDGAVSGVCVRLRCPLVVDRLLLGHIFTHGIYQLIPALRLAKQVLPENGGVCAGGLICKHARSGIKSSGGPQAAPPSPANSGHLHLARALPEPASERHNVCSLRFPIGLGLGEA
jgi:hypothetical protein